MKPIPCRTCHCSDPCDFAERLAETIHDGDEYSERDREREADRGAERYEEWLERIGESA